jgi:hypothetical protein
MGFYGQIIRAAKDRRVPVKADGTLRRRMLAVAGAAGRSQAFSAQSGSRFLTWSGRAPAVRQGVRLSGEIVGACA